MRHTVSGALLYLRLTTARGWLTSRLSRLKQPKYLVGAVVGVAYIYFFFIRNLTRNGMPRVGGGADTAGAPPGSAPRDPASARNTSRIACLRGRGIHRRSTRKGAPPSNMEE